MMTTDNQQPQDKSRACVVSYNRFGSRAQLKGNSIDRQVYEAQDTMTQTDVQHPQYKSQVQVFAYVRSAAQSQTAIERQLRTIRAWCKNEGYMLHKSDELVDDGVSGNSGANAEAGKLSILKQKLAAGEIAPGSMLIVESFDRISRQEPQEAMAFLLSLISAGLILVTLSDGRLWGARTMDISTFIMSVHAAHLKRSESLMRSARARMACARRATLSLQA